MRLGVVFIAVGLLACWALFASCGKKTPPIPPQAIIPAPVADLSYRLDDRGVTLLWSPPKRSEQGEKLPRIDSFLVEKAEYDLDGFCKNCPVRYTEFGSVTGDDAAASNNEKITYRDESLQPGNIYYYRVKTKIGWRVISRPSEPVSFEWQPARGISPE